MGDMADMVNDDSPEDDGYAPPPGGTSARRPDVYGIVLGACEFSSAFCMDNEDERRALADVITCALLDDYEITPRSKSAPTVVGILQPDGTFMSVKPPSK